jgi:thiol-disulfide isomerase/thioredoxin
LQVVIVTHPIVRPTLGLLATALTLGACKEDPHAASAPPERSQAVAAVVNPSLPAAPTVIAPALSAAHAAPKPHRALCGGQLREGRALPKKHVSQASLDPSGLPEALSADAGGFTWVNFWAAWCAPCKEEIPRLLAWQRELPKRGAKFRVAFVSLDDDERQLRQFLEGSSGLRATYWLKEGHERDDWLKAASVDPDPELPVHLLVDGHGRIRCKVQGAVEDADLEDLAKLVANAAE